MQTSLFSSGKYWLAMVDQTPRLFSPLPILLISTNTTFGTLCWSYSFTYRLAHLWRHILMKLTWRKSRFLVILLLMCCVTKWRFIVLMNAPFGIIAGASLHRLVIVNVTTQALLVLQVRGGRTINKWWSRTQSIASSPKDLYQHHCHQNGCAAWHHCRNDRSSSVDFCMVCIRRSSGVPPFSGPQDLQVVADFGQSNFGQSIFGQPIWPANFGQSIFGQN